MGKPYVVYGQRGTGSVPLEAALLLLGEPYEVVDRPDDEVMARVSPLLQVPALVLPNEEVMTESAAILIYLADSHPAARLSPPLDDPRRPAFLRWIPMCLGRSTRWSGCPTIQVGSPQRSAQGGDPRPRPRAHGPLLADDGRPSEPRPLHPGRGPFGARSLRDSRLVLGPAAGAVLSGGTQDGAGGPSRGSELAAGGIAGRAVSLKSQY
jgi:hypothetical protein